MDLINYITIDENSRTPKYRQIVDLVVHHISIGNLKIGQKMPSINMFSEEFLLSRDTIEKAYNILKERKVITSIRGKGYYITQTKLISKTNILFLVNKLSNYKMKIYNSFIDNIGANSHTDLHIYHCDENLFTDIMEKSIGAYDFYIIMPHFKTKNMNHISNPQKAIDLINKIPREKLILLDNRIPQFDENVVSIYQDFENDIYDALKKGLEKITTYRKIILIYPDKTVYPYPKRILNGFIRFCVEFNLDYEILNEIYEDMVLNERELFITIEESDLVNLVKSTRDKGWNLGKEIGIISYNDTPLKELLGITVVSTDFVSMGIAAANIVMGNERNSFKNKFSYIERSSL